MRIVLHNPQSENWFKTPLAYYLQKNRASRKYEYLFDFFLSQGKVTVLIDNNNFASPVPNILRLFLPPRLEFYLWAKLNGVDQTKVEILTNSRKLTKRDVLISFAYGHLNYVTKHYERKCKKNIEFFKKITALKVFHLTHYLYNIESGSLALKEIGPSLLIAENNLAKNSPFFEKYFNWYSEDVYPLPFVPQRRFTNQLPFSKRKNVALATGTITFPIKDSAYLNHFGHGELQPMRRKIYDRRESLRSEVDCNISQLSDKYVRVSKSGVGPLFRRLRRGLTQLGRLTALALSGPSNESSSFSSDRAYMRADLVAKMNEYKMCIVPEEAVGLPGISFAEAMACGCAYIGLDDPMYRDLGMVPGRDYIGYDGSQDDLVAKIRYYQNNEVELETIAKNGLHIVQSNWNASNVIGDFLRRLERLRAEKLCN